MVIVSEEADHVSVSAGSGVAKCRDLFQRLEEVCQYGASKCMVEKSVRSSLKAASSSISIEIVG